MLHPPVSHCHVLFLARGVQYVEPVARSVLLQVDVLPVHVFYGGIVVVVELVLREPKRDARLAHPTLADDGHLQNLLFQLWRGSKPKLATAHIELEVWERRGEREGGGERERERESSSVSLKMKIAHVCDGGERELADLHGRYPSLKDRIVHRYLLPELFPGHIRRLP